MGKKVVAMTEMISLSEQLVLNITKGKVYKRKAISDKKNEVNKRSRELTRDRYYTFSNLIKIWKECVILGKHVWME